MRVVLLVGIICAGIGRGRSSLVESHVSPVELVRSSVEEKWLM